MTPTQVSLHLNKGAWYDAKVLLPRSYTCGYCSEKVSSKEGYYAGSSGNPVTASLWAYICGGCNGLTIFTAEHSEQFPGVLPGRAIEFVPDGLLRLYEEARTSTAAGANTAAVLICRKMLMNIAVSEGAKEGETFVKYVEYLANKGFVPPNGKAWVDHIRQKGNEATHEIALMDEQDAITLITFVEMLLRFIYEFPNKIPNNSPKP